MKNDYLFWFQVFILLWTIVLNGQTYPQSAINVSPDVNLEALLPAVGAKNLDGFETVALGVDSERKRIGRELQKVFQDSHSSNLAQCQACYCLGLMRFSEAGDTLAARINLTLDMSQLNIQHRPLIPYRCAADAVVKIGNPCIPRLVENLGQRDEKLVRELSLKALCQIEGDKNIVEFRLKRTLAAESNPLKRQRLQSAIDSLLTF